MTVRVLAKTQVAEGICLFTLGREDGGDLPSFTAGAHILVHTPAGVARRYSLCGSPSDRTRYMIAVKREANGGGGSISMVDGVSAGDDLVTGPPENYFTLSGKAALHLLIAGGIGITPIIAMARHLEECGSPYRLIYCARSPEAAAFRDELSSAPFAGRTLIHYDHGDLANAFSFSSTLAERRGDVHVYCCGPRALMDAVREAARHWPRGTVHFEDFGTSAHAGAEGERPFRVRLARSGRLVEVAPGSTILDALRAHGVDVPSSCQSGTCGTCRTKLLAGMADHRDYVLDDSEHATDIMICVSRARSDELTIDL